MITEQIKLHLTESCPWRDSVIYFDSIDSTNTRAKLLAAQGAPHGTILLAEHQTGGRGRLGRSFLSPAGTGIYLSVILRPNCPPDQIMHLTCAAAVAMCNAVEQTAGFRPRVKWTNDLVHEKRKLGGILTELGLDNRGLVSYAVIGIGLNCNQELSDFPPELQSLAGSLSMFAMKNISRSVAAAAMIQSLSDMDQQLLTGKDQIMERYRSDCMTIGQEISLIKADGSTRHGKAVDVDENGGLIVQFESGQTETVTSGEVSVRGMYGYI